MELIIAIALIFLGIILVQIYLFYDRKKQREDYPKLWKEFETCLKFKVHSEIITSGNNLIFNKYLSQEHLTIIHNTALELEVKFPEFKELRLNAYNKQLHYNRIIESAGSSGGIKQTWFSNKKN